MSSQDSRTTRQTTPEEEALRILIENNRILKENNQLMKDMLRKIAINTS